MLDRSQRPWDFSGLTDARNMKKSLLMMVLVVASLVLAGCTTRYQVRMNNGTTFTTKGRPRFDAQRNLWFYTDANGQTNAISGLRVAEIAPAERHPSTSTFQATPPR